LAQVTQGATTTRFEYLGSHLIAERNASGTLLRRYVHGPGEDEPLVWYEGTGTADRRFLHADERGSIIAVSNSTGVPLALNTYDEYGIPGAGNQGRFQYTGQAWLAEVGLYHYKARVYSPTLGRFLQTDPTGYDDGPNLYAYVGSDPINHTDPTGTICTGSHIENKDGTCASTGGNTTGSDGAAQSMLADRARTFAASSQRLYTATAAYLDDAVNSLLYGGCPGSGDCIDSVLAALPPFIGVARYAGVARTATAARTVKAVNLPAWKNVGIDMGHVLERHTANSALAAGRTTFPELMNAKGIERAIREAYRYGEKIGSQGDRVLMQGTSSGMTIEMWVNRARGMIETAYPVVR
jgi:RHS repeat-associated protein